MRAVCERGSQNPSVHCMPDGYSRLAVCVPPWQIGIRGGGGLDAWTAGDWIKWFGMMQRRRDERSVTPDAASVNDIWPAVTQNDAWLVFCSWILSIDSKFNYDQNLKIWFSRPFTFNKKRIFSSVSLFGNKIHKKHWSDLNQTWTGGAIVHGPVTDHICLSNLEADLDLVCLTVAMSCETLKFCLLVSLFQQDYTKSSEPVYTKLCGRMGHGPSNNLYHFGLDQ